MEELSDHLVNRSECVKTDGSFKFEKDFMEDFLEVFQEDFIHEKSSEVFQEVFLTQEDF